MLKAYLRGVALTAAAIGLFAGAPDLHAQSTGKISIEQPWSRATPPGAKIGVGYLTIRNAGSDADRLVSATSPAAGKVEVHEMTMNNGVMTMRQTTGGVPIPAGKTVALAPGGYHMMFVGLKAPLQQGKTLAATLTFEKAGKVEVTFPIEGVGATKPMPTTMPMPMPHTN
jgi:copper(I)-binding protein